MVQFSPDLKNRLFEAATILHKLGFTINTILPNTCTVFGTFDAGIDHTIILNDTKEIVRWKVDV